tara:strand:- start:768 stop:872 length:105 start_codon:yes stop_codon:yes gene_type:complete
VDNEKNNSHGIDEPINDDTRQLKISGLRFERPIL